MQMHTGDHSLLTEAAQHSLAVRYRCVFLPYVTSNLHFSFTVHKIDFTLQAQTIHQSQKKPFMFPKHFVLLEPTFGYLHVHVIITNLVQFGQ